MNTPSCEDFCYDQDPPRRSTQAWLSTKTVGKKRCEKRKRVDNHEEMEFRIGPGGTKNGLICQCTEPIAWWAGIKLSPNINKRTSVLIRQGEHQKTLLVVNLCVRLCVLISPRTFCCAVFLFLWFIIEDPQRQNTSLPKRFLLQNSYLLKKVKLNLNTVLCLTSSWISDNCKVVKHHVTAFKRS